MIALAQSQKFSFAFTLIELLVVIAIISLLSSVVLASLSTARDKAKDAAIKQDLISVRTSAELYYADNGNSYSNIGQWGPSPCPGTAPAGAFVSMFHSNGSNPINTAINHARTMAATPPSLTPVACAVNSTSYIVIVATHEIAPSATEYSYFCIDSNNNAKTIYIENFGFLASQPYYCPST